MRQDDANIANLQRQQASIQAQTRQLEGRVQSTPMVEQQYKEMTRNYETASLFYKELLTKSQNSTMAKNLVQQQDSEQFKVYDPPSFPEKPSFPKKTIFCWWWLRCWPGGGSRHFVSAGADGQNHSLRARGGTLLEIAGANRCAHAGGRRIEWKSRRGHRKEEHF